MALVASVLEGPSSARHSAVELRVRGRVQGVGFRPAVWRMARRCGLDGDVRNDADGVLIRLAGPPASLDQFRALLEREPPPLAQIRSVEVANFAGSLPQGFSIAQSAAGTAHTEISPDARICDDCATEIADPGDRRYGYPLTNCTHCGPRLSIIRGQPYDRDRTTMAPFPMCDACLAEYRDPANRRFHAEPTACPDCGPVVRCLTLPGVVDAGADPIGFAAAGLKSGDIIALKGVGGYQLACDAANAAAVTKLRAGKRRDGKPFALMARDLAVIRRYAALSAEEAHLLASPQAPIVLLDALPSVGLPEAIAPGLATLGFMLPTSPLHALLLRDCDRPVVMTSGNFSDQPQITDDSAACEQLGAIASHILLHDRTIAGRVDDSVVRFMAGSPRLLRRARGYAPAPIALPPGFEAAPDILALGGELKATFCLIKDFAAILSQHQGDLEHPAAFDDYRKNLALYRGLFDHAPLAIAADLHPEYLSSKLATTMPEPLIQVQHHHAHAAACLCDNEYPLDAPPVLGVVLDGLGWGGDGSFWGAEFLLADYHDYCRLAAFPKVAMPGGAAAVREPWRNLYAHIRSAIGWEAFRAEFPDLAAMLSAKPVATIEAMIARGLNASPASSCGRLFDAAAAALGLGPDRQSYEGDAAARLEALASADPGNALYPAPLGRFDAEGVRRLDLAPLWLALFQDLGSGTPPGVIASRFHHSLAAAIATTCATLAEARRFRTVALSGGCFQNRLLFEQTERRLLAAGFNVLSHRQVPANDGGLALGQAVIAAARLIAPHARSLSCV